MHQREMCAAELALGLSFSKIPCMLKVVNNVVNNNTNNDQHCCESVSSPKHGRASFIEIVQELWWLQLSNTALRKCYALLSSSGLSCTTFALPESDLDGPCSALHGYVHTSAAGL